MLQIYLVHPVKNVYSQRSHSALGNTASSQNNPEPSPSSSLANEEIGSTADKNGMYLSIYVYILCHLSFLFINL